MTKLALIAGGGVLGLLGLLGALAAAALGTPQPRPTNQRMGGPRPVTPGAAPPLPPARTPPPPTEDDVEALARMLVSETSHETARVVIGWITVQVAQRRGLSVSALLTSGKGYGGQLRDKVAFYASTAKAATDHTRALARQILAGAAQPSAEIRRHRPGSWVEQGQGVADQRILGLQARWKEGIYGRLAGTRWYLFSSDSPLLTASAGQSASDVLAQVPVLQPLDRSVA